jgi:hypothetical protein
MSKLLLKPELIDLLQRAYSAEKAAAFAYQGHAGSLRNKQEKDRIHEIENDEWIHRKEVLDIMKLYDIPVSRWYEFKFYLIGKSHPRKLFHHRKIYAFLFRRQPGERKCLRVFPDETIL